MPDARPPWQTLFDRVRVVRSGSSVIVGLPTDAELDGLEAELGVSLPASYREFMKRFGPGDRNGWALLEPIVPRRGRKHDGVAARTALMREFSTEFGESGDHLDRLATFVYFGSSGGGDHYAWCPTAVTSQKPYECRFYMLPHGHED